MLDKVQLGGGVIKVAKRERAFYCEHDVNVATRPMNIYISIHTRAAQSHSLYIMYSEFFDVAAS